MGGVRFDIDPRYEIIDLGKKCKVLLLISKKLAKAHMDLLLLQKTKKPLSNKMKMIKMTWLLLKKLKRLLNTEFSPKEHSEN